MKQYNHEVDRLKQALEYNLLTDDEKRDALEAVLSNSNVDVLEHAFYDIKDAVKAQKSKKETLPYVLEKFLNEERFAGSQFVKVTKDEITMLPTRFYKVYLHIKMQCQTPTGLCKDAQPDIAYQLSQNADKKVTVKSVNRAILQLIDAGVLYVAMPSKRNVSSGRWIASAQGLGVNSPVHWDMDILRMSVNQYEVWRKGKLMQAQQEREEQNQQYVKSLQNFVPPVQDPEVIVADLKKRLELYKPMQGENESIDKTIASLEERLREYE